MANGGLAYSLVKSKFKRNYKCLEAIVTAGASDTHIIGDRVAPSSLVYNANNELVAKQYATSQDFMFTGSNNGIVLQIVTSGSIDIVIKTSIDGINFDTPSGFTTNSGMTSSTTYRLIGIAPDEYIKISITRNSGNYYINALGGGDR